MLLELHLVRTFVAILEAGSFSGAATALGLSQPTVSQHVRRLEQLTGERLFQRDTHSVALTPNGAVLERFAREMLALDDQAKAYYAGANEQTRIRLGISEDLALTSLPQILRHLTKAHPDLQIDLTIGLTSMLYPKLDGGHLDLVLAKRRAGDQRGVLVRRERLAWLAHRDFHLEEGQRVPLVIYPTGSITTRAAVTALERAGLPWRMACSAETLTGIYAGLHAGLGVSAQAPMLLDKAPGELRVVDQAFSLPELEAVEFVLLGRSQRLTGLTERAAHRIIEAAGWGG
ncbi:LysR substrate-binding domain-containing protein [Sphingomonas fuzhouensis]|uniref:LysR substrate-binding domain-containing protein n=1 Tax=Sphingomonas fuzhouensis TaxID=3106033 RepID=UPI002AFE76C2|nr:LysR substrate-binding domain-containing protein [Sphingomonas sp. SGZ-02]